MNNELIIFGAGGHTRSLIPLIKENGYDIIGIYDDSFNIDNEFINNIPIKGKLNDFDFKNFVVLSYGDGEKRRKLTQIFKSSLFTKNLIHNSAIISHDVKMDIMNQVFAGTIINSNVRIGQNNIINTGAIIEHEAIIGNYNHISVGSIIAGRVQIGNNCFIGAGAVVIDKIKIMDNVIVGANSVVIKDIVEPGTYAGNPVKRIR